MSTGVLAPEAVLNPLATENISFSIGANADTPKQRRRARRSPSKPAAASSPDEARLWETLNPEQRAMYAKIRGAPGAPTSFAAGAAAAAAAGASAASTPPPPSRHLPMSVAPPPPPVPPTPAWGTPAPGGGAAGRGAREEGSGGGSMTPTSEGEAVPMSVGGPPPAVELQTPQLSTPVPSPPTPSSHGTARVSVTPSPFSSEAFATPSEGSASAGSADNMLFTLGAEGPAPGSGSSGRRAQRHRSRVLRGAPTTPSSSSAAAAPGFMPGPAAAPPGPGPGPAQPFGGSDPAASGAGAHEGGAAAPQVRHAGAAGGEWRPPHDEPSQPHTPQGGGGCSGGFTIGSAGAAEASPAGRKAGSAKSRASSKLRQQGGAAQRGHPEAFAAGAGANLAKGLGGLSLDGRRAPPYQRAAPPRPTASMREIALEFDSVEDPHPRCWTTSDNSTYTPLARHNSPLPLSPPACRHSLECLAHDA